MPEREEQPAGERAEQAGEGRDRRGPVKVVVTDAGGQVVRTLYGPGKQGLNRVTWNMRYDDAKRLNSARRPDEENETFNQGGPAALPGKYKVAVTAAGKTQNTEVAVEADPRMAFDMEAGRAHHFKSSSRSFSARGTALTSIRSTPPELPSLNTRKSWI